MDRLPKNPRQRGNFGITEDTHSFIYENTNEKCVSANMNTGQNAAEHRRIIGIFRSPSKRMMRTIVDVNVNMVAATEMKSNMKPNVSFLGSEARKSSSSKGDVRMERNVTTEVKEQVKERTSRAVKDMKRGEWSRIGKPLLSLVPPGTVKAAAKTTVATRTATPEHD